MKQIENKTGTLGADTVFAADALSPAHLVFFLFLLPFLFSFSLVHFFLPVKKDMYI